jgi:hypothetical protein
LLPGRAPEETAGGIANQGIFKAHNQGELQDR